MITKNTQAINAGGTWNKSSRNESMVKNLKEVNQFWYYSVWPLPQNASKGDKQDPKDLPKQMVNSCMVL